MTTGVEPRRPRAARNGSPILKPGGPGRPPADVSAEQLNRLMLVAFRHFLEFGPDRASVQAIADEVGLTRQTIYLRFGSKEEFFSAIIHSREIKFFKSLPFDFETDDRPADVVLEEYARITVDHLLSPERIALGRAMYGGLHRYPHLVQEERETYQRSFSILAAYFCRVAAAQGIDLDGFPVAQNFTAQLVGIQLPVILGTGTLPSAAKRAVRIAEIVRATLKGYALDGR